MRSETQAPPNALFVEAARNFTSFGVKEKIPSHPHIELQMDWVPAGGGLQLIIHVQTSNSPPIRDKLGTILRVLLNSDSTEEERVRWARKGLLIFYRIRDNIAAIYDIMETSDPDADMEEVAMLMFQS